MKRAVLVMAYGSPRSLDEVGPYFTDIRGGRPPSPEALRELTARYQRIGGPSPLNDITFRQATELEHELGDRTVYVGMKHWHPFISEAVNEMVKDGIDSVLGLVLAPHYSSKSIGEYEKRILAAKDELNASFDLTMVNSWYHEPRFVEFVARSLTEAMQDWDSSDPSTKVFFTAHSIPKRIIDAGDPYADELRDSARIFAESAGISNWDISWQSASATGEPWLGPDILDTLVDFSKAGGRRALIAPVGFTSDHLEILFDVDVECVEKAQELGIELRRIQSPNDQPDFISALSSVVRAFD